MNGITKENYFVMIIEYTLHNKLKLLLRNYKKYILLSIFTYFIPNALFSQPCSNSVINAKFIYTQTCNTKIISFTNTSLLNSGTIVSVNWNFGDGNFSNQLNPVYTYTNYGTYLVSLTINHSSGCVATYSDSVKVLAPVYPNFTFNYDSVCPDQLITFTNLTIGSGLSYKWYFRDGPNYYAVSNTAVSPSHYFTNAIGILGIGYKSFPIKLEAIDSNGCVYSYTKTLTLKQRPNVDFVESGNFKRCQNVIGNSIDTAYIYNFSNLSQISSYQINWGNGGGLVPISTPFTNTIPVTNIYSGISNYPIEIRATGNNGCVSVFKDTFKIITIPQPEFSSLAYNAGCIPFTIFTVNNSTGITSNTLTYVNWGDNVVDTLPLGAPPGDTLYHTYNSSTCINGIAQPFTIIMTTKNECGAPFKSYGPINAFKPPQADINTTLPTYCVGTPVVFQNLTLPNYCANNPRTYYTWDFGDTIISMLAPLNNPKPNITRVFNQPGTYTVYMTAENNSPASSGKPGCGATMDSVQIIVYDADANFTFDTVCFGNPTKFTDLSTANGGTIVSRTWNFGDGNTSNATNPMHTYASPGTYIVKLTVVSSHSCTDYKTDTVIVYALPNTNFNYLNSCFGDTTYFQNTTVSNSDSIISYLWNFGGGLTSNSFNTSLYFSNYGVFNVTLEATNNKGCFKDTTIAVEIYQNPTASFYTDTVCSGYQRIFTNNSSTPNGTISSYFWNLGDGVGTCYQADTVYNYPGAGVYIVSLSITDSKGCKDDTSKNLYFGFVPIADFTFSNLCFGSQTYFTNISNDQGVPLSYTYWDFGDSTFSSTNNPSHTFTVLKNYDVKLTVSNINGCIDSITKIIVIDTLPSPFFTANTVCFGDTTYFTDYSFSNSGNIVSRHWDFGDGNFSTINNPKHLYSSPGSYFVTLTITDINNCTNDTTIKVDVRKLPDANYNFGQTCIGAPVYFTPTNNGTTVNSWLWNFGNNNDTSTLKNSSYIYNSNGNYSVNLKVSDIFGCKNDTTQIIYVSPFPTADFLFDTVCYGDTTQFTDISNTSGIPLSTWQWQFNNQGVSNIANPNFLFDNAGLYNTKLIITNIYGCSDSISKLVKVDTTPYTNFVANDVCIGNITNFTDLSTTTGSPIYQWHWNFGNGDTSYIQNPQYLYSNPGIYNVSLSVKKTNGCKKDTTKNVYVHSLPISDFTNSSVCVNNLILFNPVDTLNTIISAVWNFADGTIDSIINPTHIYLNSGSYDVYLKITDSNGCVADTIKSVFISPLPVAQFTSDTICMGDSTQFINLSQGNGFPINVWEWNFGDSTNSQLSNPAHLYLNSGLYNVTLKAYNILGCVDSVTNIVKVDTLPIANFSANNTGLGNTTYFNDLSISNASVIISWLWNFGDGNTSNIQNPQHIYNLPGSYNVTLIITNSNGCKDTITKIVYVYNLPIPNFNSNNVCFGQTSYFADSSYSNYGTIISWSWDFGDGNTSTLQNPSHLYTNSGIYNVKLKVIDNFGGTDSIEKQIVVYQKPIANFNFGLVCSGFPTQFNDSSLSINSNIVGWNWSFGYGAAASNIQNPQFQYPLVNSVSSFPATLVVTDGYGCKDTITKNVFIFPPVKAEFINNNACNNTPVNFVDFSQSWSGSIVSWAWNFGDGNTSSFQSPNYSYTNIINTTIFNVILEVIDTLGCKDTVYHPVIVYPQPIVNFKADTTCLGFQTIFTDLSYSNGGSITSWNWNFGGTGTSALKNTGHTFPAWGIYNTTLSVTDTNGCSNSITKPVIVDSIPEANFSYTGNCASGLINFTDISIPHGAPNISWYWDFGNSYSSSLQNPIHYFTTIGVFNVTLNVSNSNGCSGSITKPIYVNPSLTYTFFADTVCLGLPTQFIDSFIVQTSQIAARYWNFGDGSTSTIQNPQHTYLNPGVYNVALTVLDTNGCVETIQKAVKVNAKPITDFNVNIACLGDTSYFYNSSFSVSPIISYYWDFGDGNVSTVLDPKHKYNNSGFYSVKLSVINNNGCSDSIVKQVFVSPIPLANFSINDVCSGFPALIADSSNSSGSFINSWNWSFGDGDSLFIGNPSAYTPVISHFYQNPGSYTINLTVSNNNCSNNVSKVIEVYPKPIAGFSIQNTCLNDTVIFSDTSVILNYPILKWQWNFGDGTNDSIQNPMHKYNQAGNYVVSLKVTDINGCNSTVYKTVTINPLPDANFNYSQACYMDSTIFFDLSYSAGATIVNWLWDFGDNSSNSITSNPVHFYNSPGIYNVNLNVIDSRGCSNQISLPVTIDSIPTANFTNSISCQGNQTIFTNTSISNGSSNVAWIWYFGDSSGTSNVQNPIYTYQNSGNYNVKLIVFNQKGCKDSIIKNVVVEPPANVGFIAQNSCLNDTTFFIDTTQVGNFTIISKNWNFGNGNISSANNPYFIYNQAGNYNVSLTITDSRGCISTASKTLTTYPQPVANFTYSPTCFKDSTFFTDLSFGNGATINYWKWDFGDNSPSVYSQNPNHFYLNSNVYNVSLIVKNSRGCVDTVSMPIAIDSLPVASFIASIVCKGNQTIFNNTSTSHGSPNSQWFWNFGDGIGSSNLINPFYTYQNHGIYPVKLIVKNQKGCKDSTIMNVQVDTIPVANFYNDTACLGLPTNFTNLSHSYGNLALTYLWNFGDNSPTSSQANPSHTYSNPGSYQVSLTVTDAHGCTNSIQKNVVIHNLPNAGFSAPPTLFPGTTNFTNTSTGNPSPIINWNWNFGDGIGFSFQQNPSYNYGSADTFYVNLIVTDINGCKDTAINPVIVYTFNQYIIANFGYTNSCVNSPVYFSDSTIIGTGSGILTWSWDFGDFSYSNQQNPIHYYSNAGTYNVKLIVIGIGGISDTIAKFVTIYPKPIADFDNSGVCLGVAKTFTDLSTVVGGNIISWNWDFGNGNTSNTLNHSTIYNSLGYYNVSLVVTTDNGCVDTVTKITKVNSLPVINFLSDLTEGCQPLFVTFTDNSIVDSGNIVLWNWNFGNGINSNSNINQVSTTYLNSGTYNVTLSVLSNSGCSSSLTIPNMITVYPRPVADFLAEPSIANIIEPRIQFIDNSTNAAFWNWDFGDGTTSTLQSPPHNYNEPGDYYPLLTVTSINGCIDTNSKRVVILKNATFYAPNAFTPNNDGYNDEFRVYGLGLEKGFFEMQIFSRWGDLVFTTNNYEGGWDGKYQNSGTLCPEGVYVWRVTYTDGMGRTNKATGHVTLIK